MRAAGLEALWTSPLLRARQTADVVGAAVGLAPRVLDELTESDRGAWEGRAHRALAREDPAAYAAFVAGDPAFAFPGGEALREQRERTRSALAIVAGGPAPALVVAHAGTIRAVLALLGRPVPAESELRHGEALRLELDGGARSMPGAGWRVAPGG